jgi:DNA primase
MSGMGSGFRDFVEEVRAAVDIVEVIGADVQLQGSGRVLKGLSPFRSEQHPSFCVWPEDQRWYDFAGGDGRGGDVFSYVQQRDSVGFKEAVFTLAERKGVRRPDQDDEAFQKEYAATAKDPEAWKAFKDRYLDLASEAEYQKAVNIR